MSFCPQKSFTGRDQLAQKLGIADDAAAKRAPLLALVVNSAQGGSSLQSGWYWLFAANMSM